MQLFQIMHNIVRAGPKPREAVLAYFGNVAKANAKRAAMRVEPGTMSTHGFIINLHTVLLSFATPFMDSQYSKVRRAGFPAERKTDSCDRGQIDKIDPLYYKLTDRINVAEETKMSATQTESDAYYAADPADPRSCLFLLAPRTS